MRQHVFQPQKRQHRDHVRGRLCMLCGEYRQQQHPSAYHRHCSLQCRFLLYSAFWASHRQQNEPNRYLRDKHDLVYQESAPTVLVGADFLLYRKTDRKEICYGKEKSWIRQRHRLHPRRRRQCRGARKPLGLPVQDVAKRRRGLRAHLRRVRAAHRLRDDAQRDLSRPPRAGKPHDRLQDDPARTSAGAGSWRS